MQCLTASLHAPDGHAKLFNCRRGENVADCFAGNGVGAFLTDSGCDRDYLAYVATHLHDQSNAILGRSVWLFGSLDVP